jgi:hypothetical protein
VAFHDVASFHGNLLLLVLRIIVADYHGATSRYDLLLSYPAKTIEKNEARPAEGPCRSDLSEEVLSIGDWSEIATRRLCDDDVELGWMRTGKEGQVVVAA